MSNAERAYFTSDHCAHVAAFDEYHRLRHIERKHKRLYGRTIRVRWK